MIQARGLKAGEKTGVVLPLLLLLSILCMLFGELTCDAACRTDRGNFLAAVLQHENIQILTGTPESFTNVETAAFAVSIGGQNAVSVNAAASARWKEASFRTFKTAVFLAGFLFVGKFLTFVIQKYLLAFLHRKTPDRARFLRELFIQKKKDGKKRGFVLAAEY